MANINEIERRIDKVLATSNTRVQTELLNTLLQQVAEYVDAAEEAKNLALDMRSLERDLEQKKTAAKTGEAGNEQTLQQEITALEETLRKAEQAAHQYQQSRSVLKNLASTIEDLRTQIKKII